MVPPELLTGRENVYVPLPPLAVKVVVPRGGVEKVAGETARGEPVVVGRPPAELVDQRPELDRAVDAAPGDHHLRTAIQRLRDRERAEIGVRACHAGGKRRAAPQVAHAARAEDFDLRQQIVALDDRDRKPDARRLGNLRHRCGTGGRVQAARVADHPDPLRRDLAHHAAHHDRREVGRIAERRILLPGAREDRHRQLGQIVEHQVLDASVAHELRRADARVAPETGCASDAHRLRTHPSRSKSVNRVG